MPWNSPVWSRLVSLVSPSLSNIRALILRKGFWGPLYYTYITGTPHNSYLGPYSGSLGL